MNETAGGFLIWKRRALYTTFNAFSRRATHHRGHRHQQAVEDGRQDHAGGDHDPQVSPGFAPLAATVPAGEPVRQRSGDGWSEQRDAGRHRRYDPGLVVGEPLRGHVIEQEREQAADAPEEEEQHDFDGDEVGVDVLHVAAAGFLRYAAVGLSLHLAFERSARDHRRWSRVVMLS